MPEPSRLISLLDLSHTACKEALASGAPVFVPVNPVEYHGPHLSLHNDRLITAGFIRDLHARLQADHPDWPLLAVDDLEVGVDPVPGRGSRGLPLPAVSRMVRLACDALADLGARRVVLMTFHGSPRHSLALEAGVRALQRRGVDVVNPFNALLHRMVRGSEDERWAEVLERVARTDARVAEAMGELQFDYHAGLLETSLALHYAPASVDALHRELPPCPVISSIRPVRLAARLVGLLGARQLSRDLDFAALGMGWFQLRPFPGYTGAPHLASAELGATLAPMAVEMLHETVELVFLGRGTSPPPILPWVAPLTLGGRLSTPQNWA